MMWCRRCPVCRRLLAKETAWEPWRCDHCGWKGGDDVSGRGYRAH
jgi:ribosomal protein L37AE/L43A